MAKSNYVFLVRTFMKLACLKRIAATLAVAGFCSTAFAQYVWLDDRGVKQYSDMPPPASVPANRILKQPGSASRAAAPANDKVETVAPAAAQKDKAPMTTAEKNADFLKRRAEQADKEKKAEEQVRAAAEKSKYCERAGEYQRVLESGERISRTDKTGERIYLSDEQRARELNENKRNMQDCK
jgi:ribosomal protein L17